MLENAYDKSFVSVASEDALPVTDAEKASVEQAEKDEQEAAQRRAMSKLSKKKRK